MACAGEPSSVELRQRVAEVLSSGTEMPITAYEEATIDAAAAVAEYLSAHGHEPLGDTSRHSDDVDNLYQRVQSDFGRLDQLRLSSLMWGRAVDAALTVLGRQN
jgi:hypothetical protein